MKRIIFLMLFTFIFISCGSSDDDKAEFNPPTTPPTPPVTPPVESCIYCIPEGALFSCEEIVNALNFLNNTIRAEVGVSPLEWDCQVAEAAQRWADYLAENGLFEHDNDRTYGENIFIAGGYIPTLYDAINSWYSEKEFFQYGLYTWCDGGECLHYTQLIWKDTQKIGCGIAQYKIKYNGVFDYVIVCKFYPPGNILGQQPY